MPSCSVDHGAAVKQAVAFYSGPECTQVLTTIVSSKRFNRANSTLGFKEFALSFVTGTLEREIDTLISSKDSVRGESRTAVPIVIFLAPVAVVKCIPQYQ